MPKVRSSPVSIQIPFDPTLPSPAFTSENVQDAIDEARSSAVSVLRFTIVCTFNSTVGNNQWLGYSNLLPGDTTPIALPLDCTLKEIATSFGGSSVDGELIIYKNGTAGGNIVAGTNLIYTNENESKVFTDVDIDFSAGDTLRGRWTDNGSNPNDMSIVYYFERVIV